MIPPDLIVITPSTLSDEEIDRGSARLLAAVPPMSTGIQLRDGRRSARQLLVLAERLAAICERHEAPLYINDRLDIALAVRARGLHLGERSIGIADARSAMSPDAFLSIAAHRLDDIDRARRDGATAAFVSPIFWTPGKSAPRGTRFLAEARAKAAGLRIYALGGVDAARAAECVAAGADGVAVIRAVWIADDIAEAARSLVMAVRSGPTSRV